MKIKLRATAVIPLSLALFWLAAPQPVNIAESNVSRETASTTVTRETPKPVHVATSTPLTAAQIEIKEAVSVAFADVPAMLAVVRCESSYRQFKGSGTSTPLISPTDDVGVMQINIPTWGALAKELNLDIYNSVADNILMGRIVYAKQGLGAWTCYA